MLGNTMKFRYQFTSDVVRDGLGLELTDERWNPLAVVFRCDANNTLTVSLLAEGLPFTEIEKLMRMARQELGPFEDGTPLPDPLELDDE
jgi:hypothetical protein